MMENLDNTACSYERAKEHVKELKGFYGHLLIYVVFVCFFIFLNFNSTSFPWAIFPIVGWGIGVLSHAFGVFEWNPFFSKEWEKRKIAEFLEKDKN